MVGRLHRSYSCADAPRRRRGPCPARVKPAFGTANCGHGSALLPRWERGIESTTPCASSIELRLLPSGPSTRTPKAHFACGSRSLNGPNGPDRLSSAQRSEAQTSWPIIESSSTSRGIATASSRKSSTPHSVWSTSDSSEHTPSTNKSTRGKYEVLHHRTSR